MVVPEGDSDGTTRLNSNDTIRMESDEATHPLGAITLDCHGCRLWWYIIYYWIGTFADCTYNIVSLLKYGR